MTNEEMKDRVLANFRKTVAEMEQASAGFVIFSTGWLRIKSKDWTNEPLLR